MEEEKGTPGTTLNAGHKLYVSCATGSTFVFDLPLGPERNA